MPQTLNLQDSYILFQLAGAAYGIPSHLISQMEMVENVTPVPNAPPYLEGVVFARGQMIPAINLRVRFGFPRTGFTVQNRLIVVRVEGRTVGLIVDSAREFVAIPVESIQPPPEAISGLSGAYLKGIAKSGERLVLILNLEALLNSVEEIAVIPGAPQEETV